MTNITIPQSVLNFIEKFENSQLLNDIGTGTFNAADFLYWGGRTDPTWNFGFGWRLTALTGNNVYNASGTIANINALDTALDAAFANATAGLDPTSSLVVRFTTDLDAQRSPHFTQSRRVH